MKKRSKSTTNLPESEAKRWVLSCENVTLSQKGEMYGFSNYRSPRHPLVIRLISMLILGTSGALTASAIIGLTFGDWIYTISFGMLGGLLATMLGSLLGAAGKETIKPG